jgi:hypothetical protein
VAGPASVRVKIEVEGGVAGWKAGQRVGVGWHGGHLRYCNSCRGLREVTVDLDLASRRPHYVLATILVGAGSAPPRDRLVVMVELKSNKERGLMAACMAIQIARQREFARSSCPGPGVTLPPRSSATWMPSRKSATRWSSSRRRPNCAVSCMRVAATPGHAVTADPWR